MSALSSFADWIADPSAYNWITLVAALAATATAIFTGYAAYVMWADRRRRVTVEWKVEFESGSFSLIASITNGLASTIDGDRAKVRGPAAYLIASGTEIHSGKHESWAATTAPIFPISIAPNESKLFRLRITPDADLLRKHASMWRHKPRLWAAMIGWRFFQWRLSSGPKFSITVLMRSRSSTMRPIRLTHSIRIHAPQAMKIADSIENKADKT